MRTTVSISDDLLMEAKKVSLERKVTIGEVIDDALRIALKSRAKALKDKESRPLKTYRGTGLQPGVDLNASSELLSVMEGQ